MRFMDIHGKDIPWLTCRKNFIAVFLLALILLWCYARISASPPVYGGDLVLGENWLFVFSKKFSSWFFPAPSLFNAVFDYNLPGRLLWIKKAVYLIPVAEAFAAGCLLYSCAGGVIAALCAAAAVPYLACGGTEQLLLFTGIISFALLESSCFRKDLKNLLFSSLLLCALLQSKSVSFPLVLLFLVYPAFVKGGIRRLKEKLIPAAAVLIAASAWCLVNAGAGNGYVFFTEDSGRAAENICAGLRGAVTTTEGNYDGAVDCGLNGSNVYFYAVKTAVAHPAELLKGIIKRTEYLFFSYKYRGGPFLFLITVVGLSSLFFLRKRGAAVSLLWLSAAYMFFIHICMPVQINYFVPAFLLFSVLTGLLACEALKLKECEPLLGKPVLYAASAPAALAWLSAFFLMCVFPFRRISAPAALAAAYPHNTIFMQLAGDKKIESCAAEDAAVYYDGVYAAGPDPRNFWRHAQAMFLRGERLDRNIFSGGGWKGDYPTVMYYALDSYGRGETQEGRQALECAVSLCVKSRFFVRDPATAADYELDAKLKKRGVRVCVDGIFDSVGQLSDGGRRGAIIKNMGTYPSELAEASASSVFKISGNGAGTPEVCSRFIRDFPSGKTDLEWSRVGNSVCSLIIARNYEELALEDCFKTKPDFSHLDRSLDVCDRATANYKNRTVLNEREKILLPAAMLQKANLLNATGKKKEALECASRILRYKGIRGDVAEEAGELIASLTEKANAE